MKRIRWTALVIFPLLSGCFETNSTDELCQQYPALECHKLNVDDGQCRLPRTNLIWHRYEVLQSPTDRNKIEEYGLVAEYRKCLELASQITPIDQTELKQKRFSALMHSIEELDRLVADIRTFRTPQSLYFLWSQIGDDDAQRQFLQLEGKPELNTAEMQYALATFYTSRDHEKTLWLLNNALELSQDGNINTEILKTLASTNQILRNKERAYIWAMVAKEFDVPLANQRELALMFGFNQDQYQDLDLMAEEITRALKKGQFRGDMIPITF